MRFLFARGAARRRVFFVVAFFRVSFFFVFLRAGARARVFLVVFFFVFLRVGAFVATLLLHQFIVSESRTACLELVCTLGGGHCQAGQVEAIRPRHLHSTHARGRRDDRNAYIRAIAFSAM